jgi:hypothetical protein
MPWKASGMKMKTISMASSQGRWENRDYKVGLRSGKRSANRSSCRNARTNRARPGRKRLAIAVAVVTRSGAPRVRSLTSVDGTVTPAGSWPLLCSWSKPAGRTTL